ncbi:gamma-glutamylcyclotransferase [Tardiphaga sp. vice352]|uniref:gamma-glutamylcyclotransferase family protein n=1 Tax=unclassified Tardiphaga TaxID=2631404 RepID=UPI001165A369|nr:MULTISPECIES: gamma-glutamylcyclotransferase family protein [unclassified Tardiphaga]QDM15587.1 gamma-glutamylcyclotransferase [Tardiphaga sp. vice278]QDM20650.1 gamma-glutamylcyclotransferase [Tardiphaga sp. vice154]QDM25784.1 gamma-glutamylcyclotransferase [Tardiphaga sp. vice304]QDM30986.1 gamma-glutamylcyclotransferase [Tardiphaga sp. vice352]
MSELDCVFVYGTLMSGFDHPMSRRLAAGADLVGPASCRGRLYRVAHYPGLLHSDDAADVVHGELYRLRNVAELMAALDDYESIGPGFEPPTLYLREVVPVTLADGRVQQAWTYIYNRPVDEAKRIVSGKFLEK